MASDNSVSSSPIVTFGQIIIAFFVTTSALGGFVFYVMTEASSMQLRAQEFEFNQSLLNDNFDEFRSDYEDFSENIEFTVTANADEIEAIRDDLNTNTEAVNAILAVLNKLCVVNDNEEDCIPLSDPD